MITRVFEKANITISKPHLYGGKTVEFLIPFLPLEAAHLLTFKETIRKKITQQ